VPFIDGDPRTVNRFFQVTLLAFILLAVAGCESNDQGLQIPGGETPADAGAVDPLAAVRLLGNLAGADGTTLLVLPNFHRFLQSAEIVQALVHQITLGKQRRTFIVILSPVVDIPTELEELMVIIDHELPGREQVQEIARGVATEDEELPEGEQLGPVLDAAAGLTRYEAEGAFSLSLVRHGVLRPEVIWELKSQMLRKGGPLSLHRGNERFAVSGHGFREEVLLREGVESVMKGA
jgi:hypothetical protein